MWQTGEGGVGMDGWDGVVSLDEGRMQVIIMGGGGIVVVRYVVVVVIDCSMSV